MIPSSGSTTHLGRLWDDALLYATQLHGSQVRKGTDEVPYISHLISVAALVLEDGGSEEEAVAALLHDAVEDQGGQRRLDDITHRFGRRVADIVSGCSEWVQGLAESEDDKPSWCSRKRSYLAHLREEADESIVRVAFADKVHNARAVVADLRVQGSGMAKRFNASSSDQVWYYRGLVEAFGEKGTAKMRGELRASVIEMGSLFGELPRRAPVVGVDGAPYGWVAVALDQDCLAKVDRFRTFREVLEAFPGAEIVAVDIPVGLVSSGPRPPDKAAKAFLGAHGSRVFETPPRSVLNELTYAAALARLRENEGRGLSAQSYALREKIFEVDACVESDPRIREVHPEISFTALAESPLRPKKTPSGFDQRARLLRKSGIWLSPDAFELKGVGADDVLDAGAAAWSARRIANGAARSLPTALEVDERDRSIAIWY